MARKRAEGQRTGSDQPSKPAEGGPRPIAIAVRGRDEWRDWVKRLADADRSSLNDVVDRALAHYAKHIGFSEPPPKR